MSLAEDVLQKTGKELFRELLRVYPTAEFEDYMDKAGQWKDEMLRTDLQLISMHRKEAGAPEVVPLDEVEMPDFVPQGKAKTPLLAGYGGASGGLVSGLATSMPLRPVLPLGAVKPQTPTISGAAPVGPVAAAASGAGGPIAELRLIALFVAKWKLDPARAKMMLAKLTPARRRYVIQNFKPMPGEIATDALQEYIAKCERTSSWGTSTSAMPASPAPVAAGLRPGQAQRTVTAAVAPGAVRASSTPTVAAGLKRSASTAFPQGPTSAASRPRVATSMPMTASAMASAKLAASRARLAAAATQRPPYGVAATSRPTRPVSVPVRPSPMKKGPIQTARPVASAWAAAMRPGMTPSSARPTMAASRTPSAGAYRSATPTSMPRPVASHMAHMAMASRPMTPGAYPRQPTPRPVARPGAFYR
eukprot:TRINITY_DN27601_c0_g1_i1.p1 TRINITY_DN27601_c0_g1~~TRINITY_DN27601_c0_g1_i1.p1  ORF type:complete len:419 (+),score=62.67 TRINITY_DN27601_c0_g1_i1:138-1394(+)